MSTTQERVTSEILRLAQLQGAHVVDFRKRTLPQQDDPDAPIGVSVSVGSSETGFRSVSIEWTPHRSQGRRSQTITMRNGLREDGTPTAGLMWSIEKRLKDIERLQRRERAIVGIPCRYCYPAWSFSIHASIAGVMRHHGLDAAALTRVGLREAPWDEWSACRMSSGISIPSGRLDDGDESAPDRPSGDLEMAGSRLLFRKLNLTEIDVSFEERSNGVFLYLGSRQIPDTTWTMVKGLNVADVVDHPGLSRDDGVMVTGAVRHFLTNEIGLRLRNVRKAVETAPAGIDVSWLAE